MVPPSTALRPAGTPSLAEWASIFQCAVPRTCQMPFRSGLPSGVRGPLYAEAVRAAGARGGVAPRCACALPAAIPIASTTRTVAFLRSTPTTHVFVLCRDGAGRDATNRALDQIAHERNLVPVVAQRRRALDGHLASHVGR